MCTRQWKSSHKHKATKLGFSLPGFRSEGPSVPSHSSCMKGRCKPTLSPERWVTRKEAASQAVNPSLKHKPFKGCFQLPLSLVSHHRPLWEQADSPVTVSPLPLLAACDFHREQGLPFLRTQTGQEGKLPSVVLDTLTRPVCITPRDRWVPSPPTCHQGADKKQAEASHTYPTC